MYEQLKLANQICFPLYNLSKEITNQYRPFLQPLDLTYPQYLVMLVLWENDGQSVTQIGEKLNLDSGTLTPLLKRLEQKNLLTRKRSQADERCVDIALTTTGIALQEPAKDIPLQISNCMGITETEVQFIRDMLARLLTQTAPTLSQTKKLI